jgi:hypothetical protein
MHSGLPIRFIQCDNRREYDNTHKCSLFLSYNILLFSCSYTFSQNGKAKRSLCSINNILFKLLVLLAFELNFSVLLQFLLIFDGVKHVLYTPSFSLFFHHHPDYHSLRVFAYLCFPNTLHPLPPIN